MLLLSDIILPAASPSIITGIRIGLGTAWMSVIAAEMVGTQSGLGYSIQLHRMMLDTEAVVAEMLLIGGVGWAMNRIVESAERHLTRWSNTSIGDSDKVT